MKSCLYLFVFHIWLRVGVNYLVEQYLLKCVFLFFRTPILQPASVVGSLMPSPVGVRDPEASAMIWSNATGTRTLPSQETRSWLLRKFTKLPIPEIIDAIIERNSLVLSNFLLLSKNDNSFGILISVRVKNIGNPFPIFYLIVGRMIY